MTTPQHGAPQEAPPVGGQGGGNGTAIAGLILAIVGLLTAFAFFIPFAPVIGLALAIVGLVLSISGNKKAKMLGGAGKGAAVGGIVVAIVAILVTGAMSACQLACAAGVSKFQEQAEAQQAALESKAQAAGYESFEAWQEADPAAAASAQADQSKEMLKGLGIDIDAEMEKAQQEAEADEEYVE